MDREGLPFTLILVLFSGAFWIGHPFVEAREFRRESSCYGDTLRLDCGKSVITVHEAYFATGGGGQHNRTCHAPTTLEHDYIEDGPGDETSGCRQDVRVHVNRRCSGFKSCNYSYSQLPEKTCNNPEGLFIVRYDCVKESNINKYCNSKILTQEGYIASPGYPQYYPQLTSCSWTVVASEGQTIFASILHLHLREAVDVTPTMTSSEMEFHIIGQLVEAVRRCDDDKLTLMEGVVKKAESCGEGVEALKSVEVEGVAGLEVRFRSVAFLPASGFLLYFKIQGCPTLPPGEGGSTLVSRNGTSALYTCPPNQVFNDTLRPTRRLTCVRDHHWNDTLPHCVVFDDSSSPTRTAASNMLEEYGSSNSTMDVSEGMNPLLDHKADLLADIIIPCAIIGILLIMNCLVLVVIFAVRRRHKPIKDEFEELTDNPPPIVSEEKFEEDSPQTSLKETKSEPPPQPTTSKRVTIQTPHSSPEESESQPTTPR